MPRFYFHISSGADRIEDGIGLELPSVADAICQGRRAVRELFADEMPSSIVVTGIDIQNEDGDILLRTPVSSRAAAAA